MNNIEVYVIVEGQTEQTFIREILAPYLSYKRIYLYPALIGKPGHKGGNIRFERAVSDIGKLLKQRYHIYVSTMFDFFRIEPDWPGRKIIQSSDSALEKARKLEYHTWLAMIKKYPDQNGEKRFIPYISMHEFEALLFSDTNTLAKIIQADYSKLENIIHECGEPEEINDNEQTAPSKRLQTLCYKKYRKVAMGKIIADNIGITTIRKKCPHFNEWLSKLELLTEM
ncbi:MAG: ATPase [Candidatus Magnetoglobus multicellularis str. Araruama]|uniref:ATPase n=1 Tax=Candidatus Magnetoglobus multicellularis str. Araruama TaxID=890399 RepID=A0A1V1P8V7_9BACT|nr:MAG: ATPase [Candidatus Magnetoglobus multicellularis str. Araruama]